ncbi:MAG TPA: metal-dependent transcriptional regulator [Chloroflexia bacterium]|nr:metal-dependent transcriptional regulator [Chloroflexia bacterium]
MTSASVEDYVKAIYVLQQEARAGLDQPAGEGPAVSTSSLAERMGVAAASVTSMMGRLSQVELAMYTPYQGVRLTPAGEQVALRVIRRHRLLELYLAEKLGLSWDQVHEEAERLEHHISPTLEQRIADALGNPQVDPHGHPIPSAAGEVAPAVGTPLAVLDPGCPVIIRSVGDTDPELLRYLAAHGMVPGATLTVTEREPFGGSLHVRVDGPDGSAECTLSLGAAARVRVVPSDELSGPAAGATGNSPNPLFV